MPSSLATGFSAVILANNSTPGAPLSRIAELVPTPLPGGSIECFVEVIPNTAFSVYFERILPPGTRMGLECYLSILQVDSQPPACKVYALGNGVRRTAADAMWHLTGLFGDAVELEMTGGKKVELRIQKCLMKSGTQLGNGELLVQDLDWIDDKSLMTFVWRYLEKKHIAMMGLGDADVQIHEAKYSSANSDPSREFLHTANDILLSLLSTDQKSLFLQELCTNASTAAILTVEQRNTLLGEAVQLKAKSKLEMASKSVLSHTKASENDDNLALRAKNVNWSSIASNIGTNSRHNSLEGRRSRSPLKSSASGNDLHLAEEGAGIRSPAFAPGVKRVRSTSPQKAVGVDILS